MKTEHFKEKTQEYQVERTVHSPISEWSEDDRPREKLVSLGKDALSKAELLAIILGSGTRETSAVDLARSVLNGVEGNLNELGKQKKAYFLKFKGLGMAKTVSIMAALELGRRRQREDALERQVITGSSDIFQLLSPHLSDLSHEEFWVVFLNRSNKVLRYEPLSKGGITGTVVDLKILFKRALEQEATSVIIAHNHPSGSLRPSIADKQTTEKVAKAAKLLDIQLLDHLILAGKQYYSFCDEGGLV